MSERRAARARHATVGAGVVELWHAHLHRAPWEDDPTSPLVHVRHTTSVLPWCYLDQGERLEHLLHAHGIDLGAHADGETAWSWHEHAHEVGRYVHAHEHDRPASSRRVHAALARDWRAAGRATDTAHAHSEHAESLDVVEGDWWTSLAS